MHPGSSFHKQTNGRGASPLLESEEKPREAGSTILRLAAAQLPAVWGFRASG
jgi:hypothetical protein